MKYLGSTKQMGVAALVRLLRQHGVEVIEQVVESPRKSGKKSKRRKPVSSRKHMEG